LGRLCLALLAITLAGCQGSDLSEVKESVVRVFVYNTNGTVMSTGSGFLVHSEEYVATNWHVIEDALGAAGKGREVQVGFLTSNNQPLFIGAKVLRYDEAVDLAVLKLDQPLKRPALPLATYRMQDASTVWVVGYPGAADRLRREGPSDQKWSPGRPPYFLRLPYRRLKRSTRPPVSTSFCLPV